MKEFIVVIAAFILLSHCIAQTNAPTCSANGDCSLNGECVSGSCVCDYGWGGSSCGSLQLAGPASIAYGREASKIQTQISSWGASVHEIEGVYHAWIAEIVGGCGMRDWQMASRCIHATSISSVGPFEFLEVAVPVVCHNPVVVPADGGYYLFHIGLGTAPSKPVPCTTGGGSPNTTNVGSALQFSTSPHGPWKLVEQQPPPCNNPGPVRLHNGTWLLACKADTTVVYSAPSALGPWQQIGALPPNLNGTRNEDAFLWEDTRGGVHVLRHAYQYNEAPPPPSTCAGDLVASHAWSDDGGATWTRSEEPPYGNTFKKVDGNIGIISTRERPKLLFNEKGQPMVLFNGVSVLETCTSTCVDCKWNSTSWTYTLAVIVM